MLSNSGESHVVNLDLRPTGPYLLSEAFVIGYARTAFASGNPGDQVNYDVALEPPFDKGMYNHYKGKATFTPKEI